MSHIETAIIRALIATLLVLAAFSGFHTGATRPAATGATATLSSAVTLAHADAPPVMRPALATAEAQGRRAAHLRWLFRVYLPRHKAHSAPQGNHWQLPIKPTPEPVMARLNAGLAHVAAPLRAAAGEGVGHSILMALSSFALPYATQEIADHIVQSCQVHACDPSIVAGLFMHEDGNINNEPGHFNNLLFHDKNPGNIKCYAPGRGCYDGFQVFATYAAGIDGFMELWDYYRYTLGISNFSQFVATYCPGGVDGNSAPGVYQGDVIDKANAIRTGW